MSKVEKQKLKLKERIEALEFELKNSLQKKSGKAINVGQFTTNIATLRMELASLK